MEPTRGPPAWLTRLKLWKQRQQDLHRKTFSRQFKHLTLTDVSSGQGHATCTWPSSAHLVAAFLLSRATTESRVSRKQALTAEVPEHDTTQGFKCVFWSRERADTEGVKGLLFVTWQWQLVLGPDSAVHINSTGHRGNIAFQDFSVWCLHGCLKVFDADQ